MNQILESNSKTAINTNKTDTQKRKRNTLKNTNIYKIFFIFFSSIATSLFIFLWIRIYHQNQKENLSQKLINNYTLSTLYSNNLNYTTQFDNMNNPSNNPNQTTPFVIGIIKIDKINLNYPILSETTNDLLEISLCKFAGPMPNEPGNLCIAGHNYVDYKLFSRLNELDVNDKVKIYDLEGQMIEYKISNIYETKPNDTSCTFQNSDGSKIITLLTCNNLTGKRLVVVAKEV